MNCPLLVVWLFVFAQDQTIKPENIKPEDQTSYCIGYQIGDNLKKQEIELNLAVFNQAVEHGMAGKPAISPEEMGKIMAKFQSEMQTKMRQAREKAGKTNAEQSTKFLDQNATKPNVVSTDSGLQYKVLTAGSGASPKASDKVKVHYRGKLISGTEFDSSYKRGVPAEFPVNGVIKGWTEALQLMKEGGKWELYIPPELGYGDRGAGNSIPPNATLIFEVELLEILSN